MKGIIVRVNEVRSGGGGLFIFSWWNISEWWRYKGGKRRDLIIYYCIFYRLLSDSKVKGMCMVGGGFWFFFLKGDFFNLGRLESKVEGFN